MVVGASCYQMIFSIQHTLGAEDLSLKQGVVFQHDSNPKRTATDNAGDALQQVC